MIGPQNPATRPSIWLLEAAFTLIGVAFAFLASGRGPHALVSFERALSILARRQGLAVLAVGLTAFLLRLALLPICPIPVPFIPDEFSFLLAGDTFASGRLTNPTPAMWMHLESIHITMTPSYMSMYFPAQGLVLAAGKVLFGHPWFGLLCVMALMCAAICWMLQAWLPPGWALLGGAIAILRIGLFSYWINSYNGGAVVAAFGGALVLGAFPRVMRTTRSRDALVLALGIVVLMLSRPYEGLLLCLPVAVAMGNWLLRGKNRPSLAVLFRRAALPLILIIAGVSWLAYYDYRAFGNPLTLPYTVDRNTYAVAPYWIWQPPRPEPPYRHAVLRDFYVKQELTVVTKFHTPIGFVVQNLMKPINTIRFFAGFALLVPLIMVRRVLLDRRTRFLVFGVAVLAAGMFLEVVLLPHYMAPFTAAFYAIGLQCMRHLRVLRTGHKPVGVWLIRSALLTCVCMAVIRANARPLQLELANWPPNEWTASWYGTDPLGAPRAAMQARLEHLPGKQLVLVRYSSTHDPVWEWVYNAPDVDASRVIWARDMGDAKNGELLRFYNDRSVWLVEPDTHPETLMPYVSSDPPRRLLTPGETR